MDTDSVTFFYGTAGKKSTAILHDRGKSTAVLMSQEEGASDVGMRDFIEDPNDLGKAVEKEVVLGHTTQKYVLEKDGKTTAKWLCTDGTDPLIKRNFVLRSISSDSSSWSITEIASVEKKMVDAVAMKLPVGVKVMTLDEFQKKSERNDGNPNGNR